MLCFTPILRAGNEPNITVWLPGPSSSSWSKIFISLFIPRHVVQATATPNLDQTKVDLYTLPFRPYPHHDLNNQVLALVSILGDVPIATKSFRRFLPLT